MIKYRKIFAIVLSLLLAASLSSCAASTIIQHYSTANTTGNSSNDPEGTRAEKLVLNISGKVLSVDESFVLIATVMPAQKYQPLVHFSSSDPEVAAVNDAGLVLARSFGVATITASSGLLSASCVVKVTQNGETHTTETPETTVTVPPSTETPTPSINTQTQPPQPTTETPTTTETPITTKTPITPPTPPTTEPTVTIPPTTVEFIPIEKITLSIEGIENPKSQGVYMGGTFRLVAEVFPENATETYSFNVSDTRYVSLDSETGVFTVSKNDGISVTFSVSSDENLITDTLVRVPLRQPSDLIRTDTGASLKTNDPYNNEKFCYMNVGETMTMKAVFRSGDDEQIVDWIKEPRVGGGINISIETSGHYCTVTAQNAGAGGVTLQYEINGERYSFTVYFSVTESE